MALALYRKYRPATFAEVVGQEHVTSPLMTAVDSGRINHAYLFSGPRGCGKTSSARILARSLNCVEGPTSTPCGQCQSCQDLAPDGPGNIDVIEIDAASHGGVDDARELRERAFQLPVNSRYKIYIIDEAHMVSNQGFNALLKVVEEPPESVVFIFATTEPDKVLPTIRSRTHHYPFRLVPPAQMRALLERNCESEGVTVGEAVLPLVVRAGGGSVRDSQSLLDQLIAGAGADGITYDAALALLGVTDVALLDDMIEAIGVADGATVFGTVDRLIDAGHDPRRFAADLLDRLRDLILLAAVPDAGTKGLIDTPEDHLQRLVDQAGRLGLSTLSRLADLVHDGLTEMRGTTAPRLGLELICARMLLPRAGGDPAALTQRIERIERRLEIGGASGGASGGGGPAASSGRAPTRGDATGRVPSPADTGDGRTPRQRAEARVARERGEQPTSPASSSAPVGNRPAAPAPAGAAPAPAPAAPAAVAASNSATESAAAPRAPEPAPEPAQAPDPERRPVEPPSAPRADQTPEESSSPADSGWPEVVAPGSGRATGAKNKPEPRKAPESPAAPTDTRAQETPAAPVIRPESDPEMASAARPESTPDPAEQEARESAAPSARDARPESAPPAAPNTAVPKTAAPAAPKTAAPAAPDRASGPPPSAASGQGSSFDVAEVRRQWPAVVDSIKRQSRAGAALAEATTAVRVEGSTLVLSAPGGLVRRLSDPGQQRPLQVALDEVLGVKWQISVVEKDTDPGPAPAEQDEPEPYDPEDETVGGQQSSLDPNEVAMSLLRDELGAQPLDEQP